jgi:nitrite reductase/ring-hydroxylating ferredoxin subunit
MSGGWIAVATAAAVGPRGRLRVFVNGAERVLWRDAGGRLRLFDNRCPHRGMRLTFGFVRGDDLVCLYHGWRFGADGGCRAIPAHPDLEPPAAIRLPVFPVLETAGLVFAATGESTGAGPVLPEGGFRPCRSIHVPGAPDLLRVALAGAPPEGAEVGRLDDDVLLLTGRIPGGGPFRALLGIANAAPGTAAAHAAAEGSDAARLAVARWLVARRDALLEAAA